MQALSDLALHFHSTLWMTYRSGFMPLGSGEVQLKSDAGWGCTLRVAQMLLAEALRRQILGEEWRWPEPSQSISAPGAATAFPGDSEPPEELARLLQLFWDVPVGRSPFSVHNLCKHGAPCG